MKTVETASFAVMGELYPKLSKAACSNAQMLALTETRGYSAIASCVVEHIITNSGLKESERLYYILADLYANYERSKNSVRDITIPGAIWEERLNLSEEYVFVLQQSLEAKGYFNIERNKIDNQNEINVITPTLPLTVFEELKLTINRHNAQTNTNEQQSRCYLDDTKMFVKFNNKQIELLIQSETLTPLQKLIWILLYMRSACSFQASGDWRSTITQTELCNLFKCSQSTASKALTNLEEHGFIAKHQGLINNLSSSSNRRKKSIWFVEALFPQQGMNFLLQQKVRSNLNPNSGYTSELYLAVDNIGLIPTVEGEYSDRSGGYSLGSGQYSQSSVSSIKDITTKSINIKNNKQQTSTSLEVVDVNFKNNKITQISNPSRGLPAMQLLDVDIVEEKNRRNIAKLTPEQVLKAVNFAKKLKREKLLTQDFLDVSEAELARQFVHHAANFKMTKLDFKTRDEEVEAALSFAWRAAKSGKWRCPVGWGQAIDLHLEREKYLYEHPDAPAVSKFENSVRRYLER